LSNLVLNLRAEEAAVLTDEDGVEVCCILYVHRSGSRRAKFVITTREGIKVHRELGREFVPRLHFAPKAMVGRVTEDRAARGLDASPKAVALALPDPTPVKARRPLGRHLERALEEAERRDREGNQRERNR
jgi:hypothetical protein